MARYAGLVAQAVTEASVSSGGWESVMLGVSLPFQLPGWLPGNVQTWLNHLWIILTSGRRITRVQADLVHVLDGSYGYLITGIRNAAVIATVHDLIPLLQQREGFGPSRLSFPARVLVKWSVQGLRRCRHLIAVSGNTRDDLVRLSGIEPEKITVVPVALDPELVHTARRRPRAEPESVTRLPPIVLHVGHNGLYKNREGVLRIFALIRAGCQVRLVMAGPPPTVAMLRLVAALSLQDAVEFVHNPDDSALYDLYRHASVFLFPSLYEGFGWPPLEAMSFGCPVVCSSAASLPEVVGDAALLAAAEDEQQLAEHCIAVLRNSKLAESLSARGLVRAAQFTLERMGQELFSAYENAMEGSTPS